MELTYENMMDCVERYFAMIPSLGPASDPVIRDRFKQILAPDFVDRYSLGPDYNRDEWAEHVCGHADVYRAYVTWDEPPLYMIVDERKKIAAGFVKEEGKHPVTGELVWCSLLLVHFTFAVVDNEVKIKFEHIEPVVGRFSSDKPPG